MIKRIVHPGYFLSRLFIGIAVFFVVFYMQSGADQAQGGKRPVEIADTVYISPSL